MATKDTILQVKTSFNATIDGGPVFFHAGELIDADHQAVKTWPQYFGSPKIDHRTKAEPVVEQATAAPGEKRGR
jgi:hypothetical protein